MSSGRLDASRPLRSPSFIWKERDGKTLLLGEMGNFMVEVNASGTLIWKLCDGEHTVTEIVEEVCSSFEVGHEQAARDTEEFLRELGQHGAIGGLPLE